MKTKSYLRLLVLLGGMAAQMSFAEPKEAAPPETPARRAEPSEAFRAYVENLRIVGVFVSNNGGAENRALLNNRLVRQGDLFERRLGVRLVSIDAGAQVLVFEDQTGARLSKAYTRDK